MNETTLVAEILLALGQDPRLMIWRNNSGKLQDAAGRWVAFGLKGSPDILGIMEGGRWLGIEVKMPGGKQSRQQIRFECRAASLGAAYLLVDSVSQAISRVHSLLEPAPA